MNTEVITNEQKLAMVLFFKDKPVNQNVLNEYTNLNNVPNVDVADYPSFVEQYDYEQKLVVFQEKVLNAALSLKASIDLVSDKEKADAKAFSKGFQMNIAEFAFQAGFSAKLVKEAMQDVLHAFMQPLLQVEKRLKDHETEVTEILLTQNGGNTFANMENLINEHRAKEKAK